MKRLPPGDAAPDPVTETPTAAPTSDHIDPIVVLIQQEDARRARAGQRMVWYAATVLAAQLSAPQQPAVIRVRRLGGHDGDTDVLLPPAITAIPAAGDRVDIIEHLDAGRPADRGAYHDDPPRGPPVTRPRRSPSR